MKNKLGPKRQAQEARTAEIVRRDGTWNARHIMPKSDAARERIIVEASKGKKRGADDPAQERMEEL